LYTGSRMLTKGECGLHLCFLGLLSGLDFSEIKVKTYHRIAYKKRITVSIKPRRKTSSTKFRF
jgi:hypothetical protein